LPTPNPIVCPACRQAKISRSRRRGVTDHLLGAVDILPWRCGNCGTRFRARLVPFRYALYAKCRYCGNHDLQRIAIEYLPGVGSVLGRLLRLPALRCAPCRHKFLSFRPLLREGEQFVASTTGESSRVPTSKAS